MSEAGLIAQLTQAIRLAALAHHGQQDKQGVPYIMHPLAVAGRCKSVEAMIVAVLHDIVEDTHITLKDLDAEGFYPEIVYAVGALSRREGEKYADFIERIANAGSIAREVKLADLAENMRPDRKHPDQEGLSKRYTRAIERLTPHA